jgi:hypothetical protein
MTCVKADQSAGERAHEKEKTRVAGGEIPMSKNLAAVAIALGMLVPAAWAQSATPAGTKSPVINERKDNQQERIGEGVEKGSLTAAEAAKLERKEAAINKETKAMKADGNFTAAERARVRRQQDAMSRRIYAQKHDAQRQTAPVGEVEKRDRAQQKRIGEGIENGSLTAREAAKVETKEAKLQREERRMRAQDGGKLDAQDKAKVNRQQNRLSKGIYRQKHDGQTRK